MSCAHWKLHDAKEEEDALCCSFGVTKSSACDDGEGR